MGTSHAAVREHRKTPFEDPTKEWESPWTAVGKLAIPKQDLTSAEGKALDDLMAFENPMVLESMEAAMQMQKG